MTPADSHLPASLAGARRRFQRWRQTGSRPHRIPASLWKAAVRCAAQHGLYQTARALGLDYNSLKKRVVASAETPATSTLPSPFVELFTPARGGPPAECILEIERPEGTKLRVELRGSAIPDLA